jgi:hypothetical protein
MSLAVVRGLEGGGTVLRNVKILTYILTWKALHLNSHAAVKYRNVVYLEMVVIYWVPASDAIVSKKFTLNVEVVLREPFVSFLCTLTAFFCLDRHPKRRNIHRFTDWAVKSHTLRAVPWRHTILRLLSTRSAFVLKNHCKPQQDRFTVCDIYLMK